ncbi:Uncharacterized protein PBTT_02502 [Plasmodiophora brassicae]
MVVVEAEALRPKPAEEAGAEAPRPKQAEEAEAEALRRPKVEEVEEVVAVLTLREAEEDAEQLHPTEEVAVASLPPMVAVEVERHWLLVGVAEQDQNEQGEGVVAEALSQSLVVAAVQLQVEEEEEHLELSEVEGFAPESVKAAVALQ